MSDRLHWLPLLVEYKMQNVYLHQITVLHMVLSRSWMISMLKLLQYGELQ
jgi:hypothetical protein